MERFSEPIKNFGRGWTNWTPQFNLPSGFKPDLSPLTAPSICRSRTALPPKIFGGMLVIFGIS